MLDKGKSVFQSLDEFGITYCHWKSNINLENSFQGKTDFDLLVAREDSDKFHSLIHSLGFKKRVSTQDKIYPGMEDFVGLDSSNGKLIHLHVHFLLVMGRRYTKNYRIPIEEEILANSIWHKEYPIKIILPEYELIILIIRYFIKHQFSPTLKTFLKFVVFWRLKLPKEITSEIDYLLNLCDIKTVNSIVDKHFEKSKCIIKLILKNYKNQFSYYCFFILKKNLLATLNNYTLLIPSEKKKQTRIRKLASRNSITSFASGGLSIGFIGCDGSGKSSTVFAINRWLHWKYSVKTFYMGKPKINTIQSRVLNLSIRYSKKLQLTPLTNYQTDYKQLLIAKQRLKTYQKAKRFQNKCYTVLFDRYPLKEFWSMKIPMDGPRLDVNTKLREKEEFYYQQIPKPDFLFVLKVTEEQSIARKPQHISLGNKEMLKNKIEAVDRFINNNEAKNIIIIDTIKPQAEVILEIKNKIWNLL